MPPVVGTKTYCWWETQLMGAAELSGGWRPVGADRSDEGMRTSMRTVEASRGADDVRAASRKARVVVRRVEPWSILKFSLLFYFCLMLIFLFAFLILYWILGVIGVLDSLSHLLSTAGFGNPKTGFHFHGYWIFSRLFLLGVVGVVLWSLVNMCVAMLYNLVSDVVGGIQVTLFEKP